LTLLLDENPIPPNDSVIKHQALLIEQKLAEFGVPVKVIGYRVGPTVTQYAVEPGYTERMGADGKLIRQKVKVSKISNLARDLALALSAQRLRVETPVPGKSYVGIEVPNEDNAFVRLKPILASDEFKINRAPLDIALGRDVSGEPVKTDLEKLPHLLIAGTTNSGKSVCVTSLTTCLVMNNSPANLRLVMLDPKMVELVRFNGLPHLMGKVETELERMLAVLRWAQMEMDARYRLLAEVRARNLAGYNLKMRQKKKPPLPRIVIIIDELADLMMSAPDQTEHSLIRLAQMARATGIHMVVATQRPSTDVITGLIKANFPARISFAMASSIDSRVILDATGAENLLGRGDMLFLDPAKSGLQRLQGVIVSDSEIEKIQKHWQTAQDTIEVRPPPWEELVEEIGSVDSDALTEQAIAVVRTAGKASTSLLQRRLRIGFPRAARLMDELEEMGVIGPAVGSGKEREVLLDNEPEDDLREE
jgi:S-DNA-T family DNA segregation ATPase FtsK/SpoIIIE